MRYWSMALHFYQPPTQELGLTKFVVDSCYLPLLRMLAGKSGFGLTINISGSLLLQLKQLGEDELFGLLKKLRDEGKIEIVNSVMYHPVIPLTDKDVLGRQISKNSQTLKGLLGVESTEGFFPPELAIDQESLSLINSNYIFVDETSVQAESNVYAAVANINGKHLLVSNRQACELLRSYPQQLSAEMVVDSVQKICGDEGLLVTANDAELFGHHYTERLQVLADLLDRRDVTFIKASEAVTNFASLAKVVMTITASTWQECQGFSLWNKTDLQKEYLKLIELIRNQTQGNLEGAAEDMFDQGNSSCYLYWLSNWPWWHPDLVAKGAEVLIRSVRIAKIDNTKKTELEIAYHKFLSEMWQYQWSGQVEKNYQIFNDAKNKFLSV